MFWTTEVCFHYLTCLELCVCSITYKYDSSPHTTTYLIYLPYLIITYDIYMKFPLPPRDRPRAKRKDKDKKKHGSRVFNTLV